MNFWTKYLMGQMMLMDKAGDDGGGGGAPPKDEPPKDGGGDDGNKSVAELQEQVKNLMSMNQKILEQLNGKKTEPKSDDKGLDEKARLERESREKDAQNASALESAIGFNMKAREWASTNAALLPDSIQGIFVEAEKENYANAVEKANAVKSAIVSEFFAVQENLDLLTENQKAELANFSKLTKNEREQRVKSIYDSIFEPTIESLKRMRKAEQVSKGHGNPSDAEAAYLKKMTELSKKKYMGDK